MVPVSLRSFSLRSFSLRSAPPATSKGPDSCAMRAQWRLLRAAAPKCSGKAEALR